MTLTAPHRHPLLARFRRPLVLLALLAMPACSDGGKQPPPPDSAGDAGPADGPPAGDGRQEVSPGEGPVPQEFTRGSFRLETAGRTLQLQLLSESVVRLHYLDGQEGRPERGWTTTVESWPTAPLSPTDRGEELELLTPTLQLRIAKSDARLTIADRAGNVLSQDLPQGGTSYLRTLRKVIAPEERFYGFGEKTGPFEKRGQRLEMWNYDPLATEQYTPTIDPIYQSIPFFLGLRDGQAYGIYLNSTFRTIFDVGYSEPEQLLLETRGGDLDYFFIYGPAAEQVVDAFTELTGRTALPPAWTLGYHQCRWSYAPEAVVRTIAAEFRQRAIPCDGLWLDIDYMRGFRSFTWDPLGFPDPAGLLSDLETRGFKVTVIIDPGIKQDPGAGYSVYDEGVAGEHFVTQADGSLYVGQVWPGDSVFPDFTRPQTRSWWAGHVGGLVDQGVRGVWIDMNEPTSWTPGGFPLDTRFDGEGIPTDHRETHNVYALLMARATRAGLAQAAPQRRPFVLTRAGFAGIQRHSAVWTGDMESSWEHLEMAPRMLLNLGLSGVAFIGTDVGGFSGGPSPELYARWIQLGSISPFFRSHVQTGAPSQEPWSFGPEIEAISRQHIVMRYRLLPYHYSLMRQANLRGAPLLRPLLFEFQQDPRAWDVGDQLMVGPHLLAAPVVRPDERARLAYLPAGQWLDYWSDQVITGGEALALPAPLKRLPLLVRGNGILPVAPPMDYVGQVTAESVELELFPAAGDPPGRLALYLDDGESTAQAQGAYRSYPLELVTTADAATLTVGAPQGSFTPAARWLDLRLRAVPAAPEGVSRDGGELPQRSSASELSAQGGWRYDAPARALHVRLPLPQSPTVISCRYAAKPTQDLLPVPLSVALPPGTPPGPIYLAADGYGWSPSGLRLERTSPTGARATLLLAPGTTLAYKYTRGSWDSVEKTSACGELPNRTLQVAANGAPPAVSDTVAAWGGVDCP